MENNSDPIKLDVRPILARGDEPMSIISQTIAQLKPGQSLLLIAPFEPKPLYQYLSSYGYHASPKALASGEWEVLFSPDPTQSSAATQDLDLRHLEPPEPLRVALEAASQLGRNETLTVHTRFHPIHLLDQLTAQGFESDSDECEADHWETHIWRKQ